MDIRRGVYYQKCHDPDCKAVDFKSEGNFLITFAVQDWCSIVIHVLHL